MIQLYPQSNIVGGGSVNYGNVPVRRLDEGSFDVRIDHNFSDKDSLFARFSYDQAVSFVPGGSRGLQNKAHLAARSILRIMVATSPYRKPTSFPTAISTS